MYTALMCPTEPRKPRKSHENPGNTPTNCGQCAGIAAKRFRTTGEISPVPRNPGNLGNPGIPTKTQNPLGIHTSPHPWPCIPREGGIHTFPLKEIHSTNDDIAL